MAAPLPLQCLFCNHLNPAGARFCNDCGSQLHLQPCDRCGAVNKRIAKNCHKCGAAFTRPAPADPISLPEILDFQLTNPALNPVDSATKHKPLLRFTAREVEEAVPREKGALTTGSRRALRLAATAILLAAIVMSGEYYSEQSPEFPKTEGEIQFAPSLASVPMSDVAAPPTVAAAITPVVAPSAPLGTTPKPMADTAGLAKALPSTAPAAGAARVTVRSPSGGNATAATGQDIPILKECPDAVFALGFCGLSKNHEEQ